MLCLIWFKVFKTINKFFVRFSWRYTIELNAFKQIKFSYRTIHEEDIWELRSIDIRLNNNVILINLIQKQTTIKHFLNSFLLHIIAFYENIRRTSFYVFWFILFDRSIIFKIYCCTLFYIDKYLSYLSSNYNYVKLEGNKYIWLL